MQFLIMENEKNDKHSSGGSVAKVNGHDDDENKAGHSKNNNNDIGGKRKSVGTKVNEIE